MIKKYSKYFITAICAFFITLIGASAKEVTVDELTELVKEINPQANSVFVIGEYAFTSAHTLTLQDIMLAARSIEVSENSGDINTDPIYNEMAIAYFSGTLNDDFELESLSYAGNLVQNTPVQETYDIKYVDYNMVYEEVNLVQLAKDVYGKYKSIYEESLSNIVTTSLSGDGTELLVNIKNINPDLSNLPEEQIKAHAKALLEKLKGVSGVKSVTVTLETFDNKTITKEVTLEEVELLAQKSKDELKALVLAYINDNSLTKDSLVGSTVTAVVNLEEGYKATDGINTFKAFIDAEIDLIGLANKAYSKYETSYKEDFSSYFDITRIDGTNNTGFNVLFKTTVIDLDSLPKDQIKSQAKALLEKLESVPGVKSATIILITSDDKSIAKEITLEEVKTLSEKSEDELKTLIKGFISANDLTIDSLIGGEASLTVNLKDGYSAKDGINKFTATFNAELNLKGLVNAAYNKFNNDGYAEQLKNAVVISKVNDTTFDITAKTLIFDMSVLPTEKAQEFKAFLDKVTYIPGVKSVTITATTSDERTFTAEITEAEALELKDKSLNEIKALIKAYMDANDITIDSMVGGSATAKVSLKEGYSAKDNVDTFTANLITEIDFETLVNKAYDKYERDYSSKLENYVGTKKIDSTTLEITAKVLTNDLSLIPEEKINELKAEYKDEIDKAKELLAEITYIPGVESLTITLTTPDKKEISANITEAEALELKDKSVDELKQIAKDFVKSKGLTIESIVGGEATVKINLKKGYYATNNVDTFKALFKAEYDLVTFANKAYTKYDSDYSTFLSNFVTVEKNKDANDKEIDTEYNVTVKTTDEAALTQLANQLKAQAGDLLSYVKKVPGVNAISIKLVTSDNRTFTKDVTLAAIDTAANMEIDEIKAYLKTLASKHNIGTSSIIGGTVDATFKFKEGFSAKDGIDTFRINIIGEEYKVLFNVDGSITSKTVTVGDRVAQPENPKKDGYSFDGWYLGKEKYDFDSKINHTIELVAKWTINDQVITFKANNDAYGKVSQSSITVPYNSEIKVEDNKLIIGETTITATPNENTAEHKYSFVEWENVPAKVTGNVTITANFNQEASLYTVKFVSNDTTAGTVSASEIKDIPYGTAITVTDNTVTIGDKTITATANAENEGYKYTFDKWSGNTATVTGDITITANFAKEVKKYTVSIASNNTSYGTVDVTEIKNVPYGASVAVDGNKITINGTTVTATSAVNSAQFKHSFDKWSGNAATITGNTAITANFKQEEISLYTIKFVSDDTTAGIVSASEIKDIPYGTAITVDGNKITIGETTITATANDETAEYKYSFDKWSGNTATVVGDITITANFAKTKQKYTVSVVSNNTTYGTVDVAEIKNVSYGTAISLPTTNKITINGTTVTANEVGKVGSKYYRFEDWTTTSNEVTGNITVTANFREYTIIDVASHVSDAVYADYGTNNLYESHSMGFAVTSGNEVNTITLTYSGTKSSKNMGIYNLNKIAVESFDIIDLMEKLADNDKFESMIWDYNNWTTKNDDTGLYEKLDLKTLKYSEMTTTGFMFQNWSSTIFSRFMSKLSGLSGGSNFANIDAATMATNTNKTPIIMTIKLKDGYCTDTGAKSVDYKVVIAKGF